jgi:hypothetical protein
VRIPLVLVAACGHPTSSTPPAVKAAARAPCTGAACWTTPDGFRFVHLPTGATLRAVKAMPDGAAWIAGDGGSLFAVAAGSPSSRGT